MLAVTKLSPQQTQHHPQSGPPARILCSKYMFTRSTLVVNVLLHFPAQEEPDCRSSPNKAFGFRLNACPRLQLDL